ncbi:unnamed protein product [Rotaria sp. Silwood2]|nr:unnamed protein product [Rotaria sp. Silwood2]CAF2661812.1 unnamed protein product [Rotaria sp. Silwood2]CAF2892236.1 unnamed protein product [Rotaria sp. Silwood2]CAF3072607.1 unnamed protein product [Rotaria sp. Silwood2]CAF4016802.1 unnamed protein product [Rotaria sp. Silwood2]
MGLRINKSNENFDNNSNNNNNNDDDIDGYSDTSDDAIIEVQQCVVHIDTGHIQLPDDMPHFPDHSLIQSNEDWTHVDDQHRTIETHDEQSQALSRLVAIDKRTGIIINNNEDENRLF